MNQVRTYRMNNGIRILHQANRSGVAHFGLMVQTGTRDERPEEHGMAHFMEHMFFKGTLRRSPYGIISRLEDVGGEINAYTTKEETAIYASFLKEDYRRAIELVHDIFAHSVFPEKEIKKEADVILSEIQGYDDSPAELIFDRGEEVLFPDQSIGRNILGTEESLKKISQERLRCFLQDNYSSQEIVLSLAGDIPFDKYKAAAEKFFGDLPAKTRKRAREKAVPAKAIKIREKKDTIQKHVLLLAPAYELNNPKRLTLFLLNNILGGPGMNSRLNMSLRERRALSYSAESHYAPYTDIGAMMIYFSCDPDKYSESMQVVREEVLKLRKNLIPDARLKNARRQLMGQLAISYDNNEHLMLTGAKNLLIFDRVRSMDEIRNNLEQISAGALREVASEVLQNSNLSTLIFE